MSNTNESLSNQDAIDKLHALRLDVMDAIESIKDGMAKEAVAVLEQALEESKPFDPTAAPLFDNL